MGVGLMGKRGGEAMGEESSSSSISSLIKFGGFKFGGGFGFGGFKFGVSVKLFIMIMTV